MKRTVGLVSRAGIVPIAHSQDTAGPMTRTVRDAAMLLNVLAAKDPATERQRRPVDYTYGGGLIYDALGSYNMAWRIGVAVGLAAGIVKIAFALIKPTAPPLMRTA